MNKIAKRFLSTLFMFILLMSTLLASPLPVQAAGDIRVTTWADELNTTSNGKCSLREAVIAANEGRAVGGCTSGVNNAADVIVLPANLSDGTKIRNFEVSRVGADENDARTGDLDILEPLTIRGAGSTATVIASGGKDRVFHIIGLGTKEVLFQDLEITKGGSVEEGGGILNYGSRLTLKNVYLYSNNANGIGGGGVRNHIILGNPNISHLTIISSTIDANFTNGEGGGISNDGEMILRNSLVSNNTAGDIGGGISNAANIDYSSQIVNSTITGNIGIKGAGIYSTSQLEINNSTIHDNRGTAPSGVKGVLVQQGTLTLKNTIISGHLAPRENCEIQIGATVISNGHNLSQDATCGLGGTDLIGMSPVLGTFDYHGGITQLFSLVAGSPAIDAGNNDDCISVDQRGINFVRPGDGDGDMDAVCDIGAYEADAKEPQKFYLPWLHR